MGRRALSRRGSTLWDDASGPMPGPIMWRSVMMKLKPNVVTSVLLLAFGSGQAMAQLPCPTPALTGAQLVSTSTSVCSAALSSPSKRKAKR